MSSTIFSLKILYNIISLRGNRSVHKSSWIRFKDFFQPNQPITCVKTNPTHPCGLHWVEMGQGVALTSLMFNKKLNFS